MVIAVPGGADGPGRTKPFTQPASFAFERIDLQVPVVVPANGPEPAIIGAYPAICACIGINYSLPGALKHMSFSDLGMKDEMKVGSIHIPVAQDQVLSQ